MIAEAVRDDEDPAPRRDPEEAALNCCRANSGPAESTGGQRKSVHASSHDSRHDTPHAQPPDTWRSDMAQVSSSSTILIDAETGEGSRRDRRLSAGAAQNPRRTTATIGWCPAGRAGGPSPRKLQATKSRVRAVQAEVDVAGHTVIERTSTRHW